MEGSPIKLTKQEKEFAIFFDEAMNAKDYEQALSSVSELIKLRKHNPVYHLWLGDCYRVSAQVDNALDSYRKALDLDGKYYIVGDDFREDVKKHINGLELIQKATQACQAKQYKEAICWIDDFIKIDPNWGDIYALRGYCNDLLGNRIQAIKDYSLSLNLRLSEQARPSVEGNIKPTEFKDIGLVMDKVKLANNNSIESSKSAVIKEYLKFLKLIEAYLPILPEIAELPQFNRFCKDIDKLREVSIRAGGDTVLIGCDKDGIFIPTREEFRNRRQKNYRGYSFSLGVEDRKGLEKAVIEFNIGKRLAEKYDTHTSSKQKELDRKKKYYHSDSHIEKLKAYQREYDKKHKTQINLKMKAYYLLDKKGKARSYNVFEIGDTTVKLNPQK